MNKIKLKSSNNLKEMSLLKRVFSFKVSPSSSNEQIVSKLRLRTKSQQLFEQLCSTMAGGKKKSKNKSSSNKQQPSTSNTTTSSHHVKGPSKGQLTSANEFYKTRLEYVKKLKENGQIVYPHKFEVSISMNQFIDEFNYLDNDSSNDEKLYSLAGRVISKRESGDKLIFYDLSSEGVKLQLVANQNKFGDDFQASNNPIKRGDIVGCIGYPGRTKAGELSLILKEIQILTPCLRILPKQNYGLEEKEIKYRMRYLDLILNKNSRDNFITRSNIIRYMRSYLDQLGFLEVDTNYDYYAWWCYS